MKVLLVYPPMTVYGKGKVVPNIPVGLLYIASYLEKNGNEVRILDTLAEGVNNVKFRKNKTRFGLSDKSIRKIIRNYKPDAVGVSIMFTAFEDDALSVLKITKQISKKIITIAGGAHVSINPKKVVRNKFVDFAVGGEGESVTAELLKAIEKNKDLSKVNGITYRVNNKAVTNIRQSLIKNLDSLPFPAFHLINLNLYNKQKNIFQMRSPAAPVITSRGCPNHCLYCSIHAVWEHSWRGRSAANVIDEIELLKNNYGIREIYFQDDSMSVDKKRMGEICDEIINRKLNIKWTTPNGIAHWTLDKKLIEKMKKAGCYRITFGIESGNQEVRRWVGKPFSLEQARELTKHANRIGMWTLATNIIGFPYEKKEEIEDTVNYAIKSDVDFALFFRLGPRPGTPIYDIFKKEGWLPKDKHKLYSEEVACDTKYIKGEELFEIQRKAYQRFLKARIRSFMNPIRIMRKIHTFEDFKYIIGMTKSALGMLMRLAWEKSGVTSKAFRV